MIELFTYLKNKSFTEGIFPRELKFASIVPILNAGDLTQITESVLTFFSKGFDKIRCYFV